VKIALIALAVVAAAAAVTAGVFAGLYFTDDEDEAFRQGVKDFQKSKSLPQTGTVDAPTFQALRAAAPDFLGRRRREFHTE